MDVGWAGGAGLPPAAPRGHRDPSVPASLYLVTLMGPVRVHDAAGMEVAIPTRKARALLGYLLLARGRPVSRSRLAALLWERSAEAEARGSLRQALSELGRAFEGAPGRTAVLVSDRDTVRADVARLSVDALAVDRPDAPGWRDLPPTPLMDGLENLGEAFGEWLLAERDALAASLRALHEAALRRSADDPAAALALAERLVALDPAHEAGWRAVIRLHAEAGDRARALQEYDRCRAALRRTLEVEPSPETRDLAARVRNGRILALPPALPSPGGATGSQAVALAAVPAGLPVTLAEAGGPRRARVGVLPFAAGIGEGEALALAYAEEAAQELARYRHFDVIAPISLAAARGDAADRVFRAHDLHYAVDGSLRRADGERRLTISLLDVSGAARSIWSDRIVLSPAGMAEVEEAPLAALVARLQPLMVHIEGTRPALAGGTETGDLVLRAIPLLHSMEAARFALAGEMLAEAVARDPDDAAAAAWAARWHVFRIGQGWARDGAAALEEAERLAALAMTLDPESADAHATYGHVSSFLHKDFDSGLYYLDRSLELNPHQASAWALSAPSHCYAGDPAEALRRLARYRELAPHHPHDPIYGGMFTVAHVFAGEFERAAEVGRRAVRAAPDFTNGYKPLLAAMGHLRRKRDAKPFLDALLRREPGFNVHEFLRVYPFRRPEDRESYAEGLRLVGVPKG